MLEWVPALMLLWLKCSFFPATDVLVLTKCIVTHGHCLSQHLEGNVTIQRLNTFSNIGKSHGE